MGSKASSALHTCLQWQPQNVHSALACQHDLRQVYLVLAAKPVLHFKFVYNGKAQMYIPLLRVSVPCVRSTCTLDALQCFQSVVKAEP